MNPLLGAVRQHADVILRLLQAVALPAPDEVEGRSPASLAAQRAARARWARRPGEQVDGTAAELMALVPEHLRYHPVVRYPDETDEAFSERLRAEAADRHTEERIAWCREHGVDLVDLLRARRVLRLAASRAAYPDEVPHE